LLDNGNYCTACVLWFAWWSVCTILLEGGSSYYGWTKERLDHMLYMEHALRIISRCGDYILRGCEYVGQLILIAIIIAFLGAVSFLNLIFGD